MKTEDVFAVVKANPGFTGLQIWQVLVAKSRSAKWFGRDSFMTALFGPSSSWVYVHLTRLVADGLVSSHWGKAAPERGNYRPLHYYAKDCNN